MTTEKGHGQKISRKQEAAIAALLLEPTVWQAAKACGVSEPSLWAWMKRPAFQEAYDAARKELVTTAQRRLEAATGFAIDTLVKVTKKSRRPGDQVRAALGILGHALGKKLSVGTESKDWTGTLIIKIEELEKLPLDERIRMMRESAAKALNSTRN